MQFDEVGKMAPYTGVGIAELFFVYLDKSTPVFGMKIRSKTGIEKVLHLHPGEPKMVDEDFFQNRDVLVLRELVFQLPEANRAKGGHPGEHQYGSIIFSAEGLFLRVAHSDGPFDVNLRDGIAHLMKNHPGSVWFDGWSVVQRRTSTVTEVVIEHKPKPATTQQELRA